MESLQKKKKGSVEWIEEIKSKSWMGNRYENNERIKYKFNEIINEFLK